MKLKPVVASLVVLGLMTPAFAAKKHKGVTHEEFKQAVMQQNSVTSIVCPKDWFNRISIGGDGSVVGSIVSNNNGDLFKADKNTTDLYLNNFNLLVNANLSDWTKATLNAGVVSSNTLLSSTDNHVIADEAYVTFANLQKAPFYVTVGKKYLAFGEYSDPYTQVAIMSPAQMLAQTNAVGVNVGVASDFGLYADIFGAKGNTDPVGSTSKNVRLYGGRLGYAGHLTGLNMPNAHINVATSYISNLWDSQIVNKYLATKKVDAVGGVGMHADFAYEAFSMYADWVGAVKNMVSSVYSTDSSKLWGANVNAAYAFNTFNRNSFIDLGMQWSNNGNFIANNAYSSVLTVIPKWRLTAEYQVNVFKNTDIGLVVAHGKSYDFTNSSGNSDSNKTTVGLARLMFQF